MGSPIIRAALHYAHLGLAVYPAYADSKSPAIPRWNEGLSNPAEIEQHFEACDVCVGIATTPSGIVVIDIDPRNGGNDSWRKVCSRHGLDVFAGAPVVHTPGGGQHIYFRAPTGRIVRSGAHLLGSGVDVIADRSGVIAPPSSRGINAYRWHTPSGEIENFDPPAIPEALLTRIRDALERRARRHSLPDVLLPGARNSGLTRYAGRLRRIGCAGAEIRAALLQANSDRCKPPLEEYEVENIATSVARYEPGRDGIAWLTAWRSAQMNARELRVAVLLGTLAEHIAGPLSPSAEFAARETGLAVNHYLTARKQLEQRGAILVHNRGRKLAPIIELRFPAAA